MDPITQEHVAMVKVLKDHADSLGEHFDTVQIFVTKLDDDGDTCAMHYGSGNTFARYGQTIDWVRKQGETDGDDP